MSNPLEPPGALEAEERAMRTGKGRMLAAIGAIVLAGLAGLVLLLRAGGADEGWTKLGRNINGLRQTHFDAFWGCALSGTQLRTLKNNRALADQLHRRAREGGAVRYGRHLRERCFPKLEELGPNLEALIPPEEVQPQMRALQRAVDDLRGSLSGYIAHLEAAGRMPYDEQVAEPHMQRVTKAWYDYRKVHGDLNATIRERLGR